MLKQDLRRLAASELLEGRKYAMPIFDYERAGCDPAGGHQLFDRPIVHALAVQARTAAPLVSFMSQISYSRFRWSMSSVLSATVRLT